MELQDEVDEIEVDEIAEPEVEEASAAENVESEQEEGLEEDQPEEFGVSFESEEGESDGPAPKWANGLRERNRELVKENRKLKKAQEEQQTETKSIELGEKPTLESCDYDEEAFAESLSSWQEKKRSLDAEEATRKETEEKQAQEWQEKLNSYGDAKQKLAAKATDFEDAEIEVQEVLSPTRQGVLLDAVKDPALMVYALGKNPKKLRELAEIKNDVQYIAALARLEVTMKVSGVKGKPKPEQRIGKSGGVPGNTKAGLDRLYEEAEKTGDFTKYFAAKKRLKKE